MRSVRAFHRSFVWGTGLNYPIKSLRNFMGTPITKPQFRFKPKLPRPQMKLNGRLFERRGVQKNRAGAQGVQSLDFLMP